MILGAVHHRKVQALIYWDRDKKSRGMATVAADWTTSQMAEAIERVNSDVPAKEVECPGKLEIVFKWTVWDTK